MAHTTAARVVPLLVGALFLCLAAQPVLAADAPAPNAEMQAARESVDMLDHAEALKHVAKVLADTNVSPQDKAAAHWLAATCHMALGKKKDMQAELDKLMALHPLFEPKEEDAPAEMLKAWRKSAKKYREDHEVILGPPTYVEGKLHVPITRNGKEAVTARVLYRAKGETEWVEGGLGISDVELAGDLGDAAFAKRAQAAGGAEYVAQTLTKGGLPNGTSGTLAAPHAQEIAAPPPPAAATKTAAANEPAAASNGAGTKALGVGVAMVVVGLVSGLVALATTGAAAVIFGMGVAQAPPNVRSTGVGLPSSFNALRITGNALSVLGPTLGVMSLVVLVFGVVVIVVLR